MQKQSIYKLTLFKVDLPKDFPLLVTDVQIQKDHKITDLHAHSPCELGYCYEGHGIFMVENKLFKFSAGDVCVVSPLEMHMARSAKNSISKWCWIYFDLHKLLFPIYQNSAMVDLAMLSGALFKNIISYHENYNLIRQVKEVITIYKHREIFFKEQIIALICLIITNLHKQHIIVKDEHYTKNITVQNHDANLLRRIQKALVYINQHYNLPIHVSELSSLCNFSVTHFRRLFQDAIGKSPLEYINEVRIMMATIELLQSSKPISSIAYDCGFPSISSFNRQFQKKLKTSPRQYRNKSGLCGLNAPPAAVPNSCNHLNDSTELLIM